MAVAVKQMLLSRNKTTLHFTQVTGKKLVKTTLVEAGGGQVKEKKRQRVKTFQLRINRPQEVSYLE